MNKKYHVTSGIKNKTQKKEKRLNRLHLKIILCMKKILPAEFVIQKVYNILTL